MPVTFATKIKASALSVCISYRTILNCITLSNTILSCLLLDADLLRGRRLALVVLAEL